MTTCDRCGSTEWRDCVTAGYTVRVECSQCGRFLGWRKWRDLGLVPAAGRREAERQERVQRIVGQTVGKVKRTARMFDYHEATQVATS